MTEGPRSSETGDDSGREYEREPTPRIPRWVKLVGIILAILVLVVVIGLLVLGGGHGPRAH
jgi:hypothetical protein